jgi:protein-tyrosine-phosphatase
MMQSATAGGSPSPAERNGGRSRAIVTAARWLRSIRHGPDRALHPLRRRAAIARLRQGHLPRSILVLCYGNICRSPYAAERLSRLLRPSHGSVQVVSAGFYESGRPPPPEALAIASERGLEMTGHRSRLVGEDVLRDSELVIVVAARHARAVRRRFGRHSDIIHLGDLDPRPIRTRTIRDPVEQPAEVFRDVYARIDRCLENLVSALERSTPAAAEWES